MISWLRGNYPWGMCSFGQSGGGLISFAYLVNKTRICLLVPGMSALQPGTKTHLKKVGRTKNTEYCLLALNAAMRTLVKINLCIMSIIPQLQDYCFCRGIYKSKVGDLSRGWPGGSLFNSYYTEAQGRVLLLCFTLDPYLIMLRVKHQVPFTLLIRRVIKKVSRMNL